MRLLDLYCGLTLRPGYEHVPFSVPTISTFNNSLENTGYGHQAGWRLVAEAMGIDWMKQKELTQAIPPAFTEFIGGQLRTVL